MRPPSIHLRVDPDTHPPDERVEAWRASLGFSYDTVVVPADHPAFRASLDGHHLGSILIADMRAGPHTAVRDEAHAARQAFDAFALDVVLEGASWAGSSPASSRSGRMTPCCSTCATRCTSTSRTTAA